MKKELSKKCIKAVEIAQKMIKDADSEGRYYENLPGKEALYFCPSLLEEISEDIDSILITGTNGKTTTSRMIASVFSDACISFFTNREGANMDMRIATLFAENYDIERGARKKCAILECDEGYIPRIMPQINPEIFIITNIFPDQKDRFCSEEHVADLILGAMNKSVPATCIISSDCKFKERFMQLEGWDFIEYTSIGNRIEFAGESYTVNLNIPGEFNVRNAAAAACCSKVFGIPRDIIIKGLENTKPAFGRFETFLCGNRPVTICLAKNTAGFEAISGWLQTEDKEKLGKSSLIIAMNNNIEDGTDTGWMLENSYSKNIMLFRESRIAGTCVKKLTEALTKENIKLDEMNIDEIPDYTENQAEQTIIIANYTAMMEVRETFCRRGMLLNYWEV